MATADGYLSSALTANGSGTNEVVYNHLGLTFYVYGTFGSGDVVIESSADGTTYVNELAAQTANFNWSVPNTMPAGMLIRATLANASGTTLTVRTFGGSTQ